MGSVRHRDGAFWGALQELPPPGTRWGRGAAQPLGRGEQAAGGGREMCPGGVVGRSSDKALHAAVSGLHRPGDPVRTERPGLASAGARGAG